MNDWLAMFPLKLVVFPGENLNLHIFEERYRQLISDCEEEGIRFGIPSFTDGKVSEYGTEIELSEVSRKYPGGESDIKTLGIRRFRVLDFRKVSEGKLYGSALVEYIDEDLVGDASMNYQIIERVKELFEVMNIKKDINDDPSTLQTFSLGHHVGFNPEQEYEFLCLANETERQDYMLNHLSKIIPPAREMMKLRERVKMNGHFKNIIPPKF